MPHAQRMESWKVGWELNNLDKIDAGDELTSSGQSNSEIIEALRAVSPEVFTDGKVDFELLQNALGEVVDDSEERYGLNWNGKRKAGRIWREPSFGTLRSSTDDGFNAESSNNIIIEGDNLEALKLMRKSYTGKVKAIYIDPPYNMDGSGIYLDDYSEPLQDYFKKTGQVSSENKKISTNVETSGRFHSKWLNMMYPRLKLAWSLLRIDGSIWISIDDKELNSLKYMCDEIFGENNFIANFIWEKRTTRENRRVFSFNHDYVLCFARNKEQFESSRNFLPGTDELLSRYSNPDKDPRGPWQSVTLNAMGGHATDSQFYTFTTPQGREIDPPPGRCWVVTRQRLQELIDDNRVWFGTKGLGVPRKKQFLSEANEGLTPHTLWTAAEVGTNDSAKKSLLELFEQKDVFDTPKPVDLVQRIIHIACGKDDIIMDFFAGSGSTGHALLKHNLLNQDSNLRYILVQLPEVLDPKDSKHKVAVEFLDSIGKPNNIAEITKERMRRVAAKIKEENLDYQGDLGFKVFKLDSSNIKEWDGGSEDLQKSIEDYVNQIKDDRTSMDILYEVMLKSGIQLTAEIEEIEVGDNKILSVDNCRLLACLDSEIKSDAVADIASAIVEAKKANPDAECMVLFLDSAFADSSGKLNMSETLKQNGFGNIRSI